MEDGPSPAQNCQETGNGAHGLYRCYSTSGRSSWCHWVAINRWEGLERFPKYQRLPSSVSAKGCHRHTQAIPDDNSALSSGPAHAPFPPPGKSRGILFLQIPTQNSWLDPVMDTPHQTDNHQANFHISISWGNVATKRTPTCLSESFSPRRLKLSLTDDVSIIIIIIIPLEMELGNTGSQI